MSIITEQTKGEELANAISHGVGTLLAIVGMVFLIVFSAMKGSTWHIVSFTIFGASMVALYLFSSVMHSIQDEKRKDVWQIFDHAGIYLLIAGTYTPFCLVAMHGSLGWTLFGIEWGLAAIAITLKAVFSTQFIKKTVFISTLLYVVMGWLIVIGIKPLYQAIGLNGLIWLIAGGLFYTVGVIFFVWKNLKYQHLIWHIFVIAGTVCHFFSIILYVLPIQL